MSISPPPPPRGSSRPGAPMSGGGTDPRIPGAGESSRTAVTGDFGVATPLPLVVASSAVLLGVIPLWFSNLMWADVLGYLLSGFVTILCLGWDAVSQRKGLMNPNFTLKPMFTRFLRVVVALGFIVAIVNLYFIAVPLAEMLSNGNGLNA